jgi:hypothetical protein
MSMAVFRSAVLTIVLMSVPMASCGQVQNQPPGSGRTIRRWLQSGRKKEKRLPTIRSRLPNKESCRAIARNSSVACLDGTAGENQP